MTQFARQCDTYRVKALRLVEREDAKSAIDLFGNVVGYAKIQDNLDLIRLRKNATSYLRTY